MRSTRPLYPHTPRCSPWLLGTNAGIIESGAVERARPSPRPCHVLPPPLSKLSGATKPLDMDHIRQTFVNAVEKRMMADVSLFLACSALSLRRTSHDAHER